MKQIDQKDKRLDVVVYVRNGRVHCEFCMVKFPTCDLSEAKRLITAEIDKAILAGPTDD